MISFHCTNCNRRINVSSAHAGKRGKCPGCKQTLTVPAAAQSVSAPKAAEPPAAKTIKFSCPMCDTHVKAPAKLIGKSITCPSCKCYLEVPGTSNKKKIEIPVEPDEYKLRPDEFPVDPPPTRIDTSLINRNKPAEDNKKSARDKLPAFLQIALYPTSVSGLITLAIFVFLPPLIRVALIMCIFNPLGWLGILFVEIGVGITVMAVIITLYYNLASAGRHDEGL